MSFFAWIILGLIAGFTRQQAGVNRRGEGILLDVLLGVVGALIGVVAVPSLRCSRRKRAESLQLFLWQ